jgi:hypothetical protein
MIEPFLRKTRFKTYTECTNNPNNDIPLPSSTQRTRSSDSARRAAHGQRNSTTPTHKHRYKRRKTTMRCRCQASTHPMQGSFDSSPTSLLLCPYPWQLPNLQKQSSSQKGGSSQVIVVEPHLLTSKFNFLLQNPTSICILDTEKRKQQPKAMSCPRQSSIATSSERE